MMIDYWEKYKNGKLSLQRAYAKAYEQYWTLLNAENPEYEDANRIMGYLEFHIISKWMESKGYEHELNKFVRKK